MSGYGEITETVVSDEYRVIEAGPSGNDIGPMSPGKFTISSDDDELVIRELAVTYAKRIAEAMAGAGYQTSYVVRRVTISTVAF
jgi:hypothetical protein